MKPLGSHMHSLGGRAAQNWAVFFFFFIVYTLPEGHSLVESHAPLEGQKVTYM